MLKWRDCVFFSMKGEQGLLKNRLFCIFVRMGGGGISALPTPRPLDPPVCTLGEKSENHSLLFYPLNCSTSSSLRVYFNRIRISFVSHFKSHLSGLTYFRSSAAFNSRIS